MSGSRIITTLIIVAVLAIPMSVLGAGPGADPAAVQPLGANALTGPWMANISAPPFPPFKALFTFTDDGNVLVSQASLVPWMTGATVVFSIGHGTWKKIGPGQFTISFVALIHDQSATFLGTTRVTCNVALDSSMNELTGTANVVDLDADGNVLFGFSADIAAERIE